MSVCKIVKRTSYYARVRPAILVPLRSPLFVAKFAEDEETKEKRKTITKSSFSE